MARLFEYQGKELLKKAKVPIPEGEVATTPQEAKKIAEKVGKPVAIKSQIWAGGRGKAGGIQFAQNPEEAEKAAGKLLGSEIKNLTVERVLVEEKLDIDREFYAGVIIDASREVRSLGKDRPDERGCASRFPILRWAQPCHSVKGSDPTPPGHRRSHTGIV
jgi:succinyl-CoA synthetase beta subunit